MRVVTMKRWPTSNNFNLMVYTKIKKTLSSPYALMGENLAYRCKVTFHVYNYMILIFIYATYLYIQISYIACRAEALKYKRIHILEYSIDNGIKEYPKIIMF